MFRSVLELVRGVGRNIDYLAGPHRLLLAAKRGLDFAFQNRERLLKIVPMRRRAAAGRNVHVDQAVTPGGVLTREKNRVCVASHANVRKRRIVRVSKREAARRIVWRNARHWFFL